MPKAVVEVSISLPGEAGHCWSVAGAWHSPQLFPGDTPPQTCAGVLSGIPTAEGNRIIKKTSNQP